MTIERHPCPEVAAALTRLADALCTWERTTGRASVLILREAEFCFRAMDGKPVHTDVEDARLLSLVVP